MDSLINSKFKEGFDKGKKQEILKKVEVLV
jgi:hypothetical protein